ncbi:CoA transferase (plasmid) [Roseomonas sp. OT10]|uniref:CaiB/BaiF CoA transferase family protein n=1 Tax=Roseomonas cutis TaxID=2897332 RepID=UPI001E3CED95|nr:CoA transferase [Roseomonas sp. OT10]UFN51534.1 CoA transferase [Roseomonas sp. OT10]
MKVVSGLRVLDLGSFITAPYAAMLLAELGADVVKVERPDGGDPFRRFQGGLYGPQFQAHNRGKRSLALDFSKPAGREVLLALAARADVMVTNFRPGVAERLGIGWEILHAHNPRLILCEVTGFGRDGPYSRRPAYDTVGQAIGGMAALMREFSEPRVPGPALADAATGLFACYGIMGALLERASRGIGRLVEVNMLDATIALMTDAVSQYAATGVSIGTYTRAALSQAYVLTCSDNKQIGLHLSSPEKFWQALLRAVDRPEWNDDPRFSTREGRVAQYGELAHALAKVFAERSRREWTVRLEEADVPFAPVHEIQDVESDPQVQHLGTVYELDHPIHGAVRAPRRPIWYDGQREMELRPPPMLGEHSADILRELGMEDRLPVLRAMGLVQGFEDPPASAVADG